jgi:ABC-type antimicrobial peptide transport system permease subunit
MELVWMGVILCVVVGALAIIKYLTLGAGLTMVLAIPLVLFSIVGLAWVQPSAAKADKHIEDDRDSALPM